MPKPKTGKGVVLGKGVKFGADVAVWNYVVMGERARFPLFVLDQSKVLDQAKKCLKMTFDVKAKLAKLENPIDIIERMIAEKKFA